MEGRREGEGERERGRHRVEKKLKKREGGGEKYRNGEK